MKSFLCVIDNEIRLVQVVHSVIWIIKYVIDLPILTTTWRQSFQKALKTKLGNRPEIRVGQRAFDCKVTIHIIVYNKDTTLWESKYKDVNAA